MFKFILGLLVALVNAYDWSEIMLMDAGLTDQEIKDFDWINNHIATPIFYTVDNQVSLVHQTGLDFGQFKIDLDQLSKSLLIEPKNGVYERHIVREALTKHLQLRLVVDPIEPHNKHLYNAEYEHRKDVWAHKCVKDFIFSKTNETNLDIKFIQTWFDPINGS